jgi:IS30 family transposase
MARRRRGDYSVAERRELWERWRRGVSISEIGRALDRAPGTIHYTIRQHGGIAPPPRCRGRLALSLAEREEISRGIAAGHSARRIAACLGRSPSTVSREVARHGGRYGYRAAEADQRAWQRARRPKPCLLSRRRRLRLVVAEKLAQSGRRSRFRAGLWPPTRRMRLCGCRRRRSIGRCSSRPVAR